MLTGDVEPSLVGCDTRFAAGDGKATLMPPFQVGAKLRLKSLLNPGALDRQRYLEWVPALLTHESPITARLFTGDLALLDQDGLRPTFSKIIRRRRAHDSAANDYDIRRSCHLTLALLRGVAKAPVFSTRTLQTGCGANAPDPSIQNSPTGR